MVFVCMVKGCDNSKKSTMKKCKRFRIPADDLRRKNWLINCSRQDLLDKSSSHHVCSDHFEDQMYKKPDRKVLLPTAVPTNFCSTSNTSQSYKEADITELINSGFSREQVIQELKRFDGNKNQAMASLFAKILKF
ncbi:52 kDa repressor of the inhibitor of the protein kinase-like [Acyrthosiphon pisum]|uniref:THAP-type domain-containing protein n=1 Tax=Acyrthosiphon pisum TaxID=7029 RepID=A0A8R1W4D3_ACYPI|nr:52 kDa repressor of the inhibitor of the protein kinase-like [Acyrthosiphon pisum]|eukprot:XP_003242177.1 PREDICTED: 52 kDa repressor of the inhibitor of the protein kinase-like [Acyrthosiphon pisum]